MKSFIGSKRLKQSLLFGREIVCAAANFVKAGCILLIVLAITGEDAGTRVRGEDKKTEANRSDSKKPAVATEAPGQKDDGYLLPNGWKLTPAGEQIALKDLPLNIVPLPDGKHAMVATSGYNAHELTIVDLVTHKKIATQTKKNSWFGLSFDAATGRIWWSGAGETVIHGFEWKDGALAATRSYSAPKETGDKKEAQAKSTTPASAGFRTGMTYDAAKKTLYSLTILAKGAGKSFAWGDAVSDKGLGGLISKIDPDNDASEQFAACGKRPYDVVLGKNGLLYVSDWADRRVLVVDPETLQTVARIQVGEHPNQLALHPTDDRLFVACASSNAVHVIDTKRGVVEEVIQTALFPQSPEGSTPDALCVSPDGEWLFVANADNNCVAMIEVEEPRHSSVKGFIPTGWYPTSLAITPDGKQLLVGVGKGNQTRPNPADPKKLEEAQAKPAQAGNYRPFAFPYIGTTLSGALSIVDVPDEEKLAAYTDQVYRNCPYSDKLLSDAPYERKTAIPTKVGDPSPITHVIYIIKENRTYDQVFSDIPRGNRDPSLLMFGEEITPNHHKLANEFVLLDNLYCNGHVSADGHPWSTMAYNTDYIARNWALTYSSRQGIDDDDEGSLTVAPSGYIWDACKRRGVTYRSYGEYGGRVSQPDGTLRMEGRVPGLVGHVSPK
ncbi:MAG: hypothetical protein RIS70_3212, partial [Planctomycetota bacterium]